MNRRSHRRTWVAATGALLLVLLSGYTFAVAQAPIPEPVVTLSEDAATSIQLSTDQAETVVAEQSLPTAIGFAEHETVWVNDDTPRPLASISKLITVLVALEEAPLDPDTSTWPTHTWSVADWQRQQEYLADNGVAFPLPIGTEIPLVDMFKLIFLPSANDMVAAYTYSVFPSNDAFTAAVAAWAERHGLDSVELVEPTGMHEGNKASPTDLIRIGKIALEHPVVNQFTLIESANIPGVGFVENTNPLLGVEPDIVGLKTGRTSSAGFNLLVAQKRELDGRSYTQLSITMGRGSLAQRAESGREMLGLLDTLPSPVAAVTSGERIATATDWSGEEFFLTAGTDASALLLPGEEIHRAVELDVSKFTSPGHPVGVITVASPGATQEIDVVTDHISGKPDLLWRLTHPEILFQQ